ncbi:hypothetical protein RJ641_020680 [Dillenia turbinata]|uniref:Uncharacterized protein n=1 Tax=Dillenia turbinata TaxID=194707 RepID=A0AAN8UF13_9MAGN
MDPTPQHTQPNYKPANKLQVLTPFPVSTKLFRINNYAYVREWWLWWLVVSRVFDGPCAIASRSRVPRGQGRAGHLIRKAKPHDAKGPIAIPADLRFGENCKRVIDEVENAFGRIDILVNSAAEQDEQKGAMLAFTRALSLELVEKGIRVNGVAPGYGFLPGGEGEEIWVRSAHEAGGSQGNVKTCASNYLEILCFVYLIMYGYVQNQEKVPNKKNSIDVFTTMFSVITEDNLSLYFLKFKFEIARKAIGLHKLDNKKDWNQRTNKDQTNKTTRVSFAWETLRDEKMVAYHEYCCREKKSRRAFKAYLKPLATNFCD